MTTLTYVVIVAAAILGSDSPGNAHDAGRNQHVVIDTDLGLDDVVALAIALQHPDLDLAALVASAGVADAATATTQLGRLASFFNRTEIPLYAATPGGPAEPPPWRYRAHVAIDGALPSSGGAVRVDSGAFAAEGGHVTVVVLGPLTRLAAELSATPAVAAGIDRVVMAGDPERTDDWNLGCDRAALAAVRAAGVAVLFVRPGRADAKPARWYTGSLDVGQGTALGEALLDHLLADPETREHYLELGFHDELAVLFLVRPDLFTRVGRDVFEPTDGAAVAAAIASELSSGRQRKERVVFVDGPLPETALQPIVRERRAAILANNGEDEWFAQLLLNELHEHLGAYSIIGVKMGLRAAELLNAPQHAMTITSATPLTQPVSCLNDGLIVATGSTPGRGLFRHVPGAPGTVEATFSYNDRTLTLRLKDEYQAQIRDVIRELLTRTTLEDDLYWDGVRDLGLEIWQNWHRRNLFEVVGLPAPEGPAHEEEEP